ncbi:sorting nexin-22 isoform X1 [Callithrix jacchus]|uniref:sorting nexin-22 isoform X1 n=1 Tax=Callithrix jacchus TaxID=9483 RepID=UPI0004F0367D|nr:sorting nexin-22 isoform X1 [Callithrix jacchus]
MLEVHIPSVGPEAEGPRQSPEKGHMVFRVEVLCSGRRHTVPRRYSEFHALHKRIKKLYRVPDFPSKRLPNWRTRGLEQRRQGLEAYIQGILYLNQEVPKELLEFLRLRHFPTDPKASSCGSQQHQRPVLGFHVDPYVCTPSPGEELPRSRATGGGLGVVLLPGSPNSMSFLLPSSGASPPTPVSPGAVQTQGKQVWLPWSPFPSLPS